jgi:hypothetical protein
MNDFTTCRGPGCQEPGSPDRPFCRTCYTRIPTEVRRRLATALQNWRRQRHIKDYSNVAAAIRWAVREMEARAA